MITTLNQLKQEVNQIANAHFMVNSFYWGSPEVIAKRTDVVYPLVFAYPMTFRLNSNTTDRVIRLGVIDKIYKNWDNLDDVHSDCESIARDFYRILNKSPRLRKRWRINSSPSGEVFTLHDKGQGDNADYVAGVYFDIDLSLRDKSGVCDIPWEESIPAPSVCLPATFNAENSLGEIVTSSTVASGATDTVIIPDGTVSIKASDGSVIDTIYSAPDSTQDVVIADSLVRLYNTNAQLLSSTQVLATYPWNITAPDATVNFETTSGIPAGTQNVPSGESTTVIIPDGPPSAISVDDVYKGDLPSGAPLNILIEDQNSNPITPISGTVSSGVATIVLPDETYNVYVNGVLNTTFTAQAMEDLTINITA